MLHFVVFHLQKSDQKKWLRSSIASSELTISIKTPSTLVLWHDILQIYCGTNKRTKGTFMTFPGILLTIAAAVFIGLVFNYAFKLSGPWGTFWSFLVVVTLAGLAAAAWITPAGPVKWGIAWIPTLFVMLLIALLLAAATPVVRKSREERDTGPPSGKIQNQAAIGAFFWLLLVILLSIILWGVIGEHSLQQPN